MGTMCEERAEWMTQLAAASEPAPCLLSAPPRLLFRTSAIQTAPVDAAMRDLERQCAALQLEASGS